MQTAARIRPAKRFFDLIVTLLAAPLWIPVSLIAGLCLALTDGRPVLYRSSRRVHGSKVYVIVKFRTMVRNADQVLNRDTVPISDTRFLNIPPDHPVYTPVGRFIERYALTEVPQLIHVLSGSMSLIGNRPLPVNVVNALCKDFHYAEDRFLIPCGLTGPVQLIGRDDISDGDRLGLEIDYSLLASLRYSIRLDWLILWNTVLIALHLRPTMSVAEVRTLMMRAALPASADPQADERRLSALRFDAYGQRVATDGGQVLQLLNVGYRGLRALADAPVELGSMVQIRPRNGHAAVLYGPVSWVKRRRDGAFELGVELQPAPDSASAILHVMGQPRGCADLI